MQSFALSCRLLAEGRFFLTRTRLRRQQDVCSLGSAFASVRSLIPVLHVLGRLDFQRICSQYAASLLLILLPARTRLETDPDVTFLYLFSPLFALFFSLAIARDGFSCQRWGHQHPRCRRSHEQRHSARPSDLVHRRRAFPKPNSRWRAPRKAFKP